MKKKSLIPPQARIPRFVCEVNQHRHAFCHLSYTHLRPLRDSKEGEKNQTAKYLTRYLPNIVTIYTLLLISRAVGDAEDVEEHFRILHSYMACSYACMPTPYAR